MKTFIAIVEQCPETGLYVGSVAGFPFADIQADTLDELYCELCEVYEMLLNDKEYLSGKRCIAMQNVMVA